MSKQQQITTEAAPAEDGEPITLDWPDPLADWPPIVLDWPDPLADWPPIVLDWPDPLADWPAWQIVKGAGGRKPPTPVT